MNVILNEDTTVEQLNEIINQLSDDDFFGLFENKNRKFGKMMSKENKERLHEINLKRFDGAIDNIIAIMKKGNYHNLPEEF